MLPGEWFTQSASDQWSLRMAEMAPVKVERTPNHVESLRSRENETRHMLLAGDCGSARNCQEESSRRTQMIHATW